MEAFIVPCDLANVLRFSRGGLMIVTAAVGCKRLLGCPQCHPDRCGHAVEFLPRRMVPVVRRQLVAETIASKPWQDVQMDMEDFLASRLSVGQKQIDTIGVQTRTSNSCRDSSSCFEECAAAARLELGQISCMMEGD